MPRCLPLPSPKLSKASQLLGPRVGDIKNATLSWGRAELNIDASQYSNMSTIGINLETLNTMFDVATKGRMT